MAFLSRDIPLVERSSECTTGDACQASGGSESTRSTIASSTTSEEAVRTIITLTTIPQPTGPSSTSTTTILSSRTGAEAMSSTSTTASPSQSAVATAAPNNTPIIVGITCGIVAASAISVLAWFFWRRKMQKKTRINSTASSFGGGKEGKEFEMARQNSYYEGQHLQPEDGRGGYSRAARDRSLSQGSNQGSNHPGSAIGSRSATPVIPADTEEKEIVVPPVAQHPAYHPLPGRSPEIPSWRNVATPHTPGTPGTPVMPMHQSQQTRHPAYHVHQLSQHPAFRGGNSPPRPAPPTWSHPAFRPDSSAQQLDSTPIIPQNELDGFSFAQRSPRVESLRKEVAGPSKFGPTPKPKHSSTELPAADVPRSFSNINSQSDPNMSSRYETPSEPCSQASSPATPQLKTSSSHNVLSRDNSAKTGISTYTIPIGLGVVDASPTIGVNPFSLPVQGREVTSAPKESKKEQKKRSNSPPPVLKSNMNDRDDHVLSWDSYGAGQLSGIGPSNSTGSARSRRQREIEQGIIARDREARGRNKDKVSKPGSKVWMSKERGSYGEIPETPLSTYTESWMERESWALR